jgi:hypothetical protein
LPSLLPLDQVGDSVKHYAVERDYTPAAMSRSIFSLGGVVAFFPEASYPTSIEAQQFTSTLFNSDSSVLSN